MSLRKQRQLEKIYILVIKVIHFVVSQIFRARIIGTIPKGYKSLVIVSNHISFADPPIIGYTMYRLTGSINTYFFAKEELFNFNSYFAFLISALKAIPLRRSGLDMSTLKSGIQILENGGNLVVFPEGTRNKTHRMLKGKAGAGYIALKSKTPFITFFIKNANMNLLRLLFGKKRLIIMIGEVRFFKNIKPNSKNARIITQIMMNEIGDLKKKCAKL